MAERLLTPQQLADYLGVPLGTIYRWNANQTGPRPTVVGRHRRYRESVVAEWLAAQTRESVSA
jgi:excisionase family DNA binding protein